MAVETRAPTFIAVGVLMITLCTVIVALRIISRALSHAGISWDDWICVVCLPIIIATHALIIETTNHGLGYHDVDAPPDAVVYFERTIYIIEIFYTLTLGLVKLSVLFFYHRVFRSITSAFKIVLWTTGAITVAWCLTMILVGAFQCTPIEAAWNPLIPGKCLNQRTFFLAQAIPNLILDFAVLIIPMPFLIKLQVRNSQRAGLVVIFVLGYFVPIISIIRMTYIVKALDLVAAYQANPGSIDLDITWNYDDVALWTIVEPSLGLVSCCIPGLQYLFTQVLKKYTGLTTRASTHKSKPYQNPSEYAKQQVSNGDGSFSRLRDDEANLGNGYMLNDYDANRTKIEHSYISTRSKHIPINAIHRQDDVTVSETAVDSYR